MTVLFRNFFSQCLVTAGLWVAHAVVPQVSASLVRALDAVYLLEALVPEMVPVQVE